MLRFLAIFVLAAIGGWALTRLGRVKAAPPPAASKSGERELRERLLFKSPDDFNSWISRREPDLKRHGAGYMTHEAELAAWSVEELKAALNQSIRDPRCARWGAATSAAISLLEEWTRREPDAAWSWFTSVPTGPMRKSLASGLDAGWPAERASEVLLVLMAMPDKNKGGFHRIVGLSISEASIEGPAAVETWMARLVNSGMWWPNFEFDFPASFDFQGLVKAPAVKEILSAGRIGNLATEWLKQDPDTAIRSLLKLRQSTALFDALIDDSQDEPASSRDWARRLGAITSELPEDETWTHTLHGVRKIRESPALLREFLGSLPDPELRTYAHRAAAVEYIKTDIPLALEFLAASTDDAEERFDQLEAMLVSHLHGGAGRYAGPELRQTLAAWNCPQERAEAMVTRMIHGNR